ncbi:MAG: ABC transporter permease subunit [Betaproteobacteria bacterium]
MTSRFGTAWLLAGFAFLYVPIATLVIFSFNESRMVTLWSGFSLRWYAELARDREVIDCFIMSMNVASLTATAAVILGTMAAFALVRYTAFRGRTAFIAHVNAPLVVPEVITGLSLLLFFVALERATGYPQGRGLLTIFIGHTSICASYAAVVIQSRLLAMDRSLEDAAMDLGTRPLQGFFLVTLPQILPSLGAAWLLTFTISLDDVVTSAFLSGPGSTTLPRVIFSRARLGLNPTVNAIATIMVVVVGIAVVLSSYWMARQQRRREEEQAAAWREDKTGEAKEGSLATARG